MNSKNVLVVQHIDIETPGIIADLMAKRNIGFDCKNLISDYENLLDYDALIIMGGPMSVNEKSRYSFIETEIELVKKYLELKRPIIGICLGSQIIASALNSLIYRNSQQELGWHNVKIFNEEDTIFQNLENEFLAFHWHGDIFSLPDNSTKLASSKISDIQAFIYRKTCYGLLFHLEITKDIVQNITTKFESDLLSESIDKSNILSNLDEKVEKVNSNGRIIFNRWLDLI